MKKFCVACNQPLKSRTRTWCDKCLIKTMEDEKEIKEGEEIPEEIKEPEESEEITPNFD